MRDTAMQTARPPLHIIHVVRQFEPSRGGLEDFVKCLSRQQMLEGHRVEILTLNREFQSPDVELAATDEAHGIRITRVGFVGSPTYFIASGVLGKIAGADIVHVHATDFFFDFLALCRPLIKARLVCTTHGGFFHTGRLLALKKLWFATLTRLFLHAYDGVVACSDSDYRRFVAYCGDRIALIDNGVDIDKLLDSGSRRLTKTIVTLGRFSTNKQIPLLIERFAELVADDPDWRLKICGVNSDSTAQEFETLAKTLGVHDQITIHVGLSDAGIRDALSDASFFVSASRYEGFGLAAVEAMSAGLHPILQANDAFKALAAKHPAVRIIDFASPKSLSASARQAHHDISPSYARRVRDVSDETSQYAWRKVARSYEDIYDRTLA